MVLAKVMIVLFTFGGGRVTARTLSMSSFAVYLSGPVFKFGRPVVNMTGLKGAYDFTLEWVPEGAAPAYHIGSSIFTAFQEQLGLKLEMWETTVSILVVDSANRTPSSN